MTTSARETHLAVANAHAAAEGSGALAGTLATFGRSVPLVVLEPRETLVTGRIPGAEETL